MKKLESIDIIAIIIIIGGFCLKFAGADGTVSLLMSSVAFYYFGKKASSLPNEDRAIKNKFKIK